MKTCAECMLCMLQRDVAAIPADVGTVHKAQYMRNAMQLLAQSDPTLCTSQISVSLDALHQAYFGDGLRKDYANLKRVYNERIQERLPQLAQTIEQAADPLVCAILLARAGNYIDFGGTHEVDDAQLDAILNNAQNEWLDKVEYETLQAELHTAHQVVYLTDNAGEVLLDQLLLRTMMARYPHITWTVLVRGAPTLNDATLQDAQETGLTAWVQVLGNGSALPGTVWEDISAEARQLLTDADIVIAKGQANFETLSGCGLNVYYLLLCKCDYFVRRFKVPRLTGMFVNEHRLPEM